MSCQIPNRPVVREAIYGRASSRAAAWVRQNRPGVWQKLLREAEESLNEQRRAS